MNAELLSKLESADAAAAVGTAAPGAETAPGAAPGVSPSAAPAPKDWKAEALDLLKFARESFLPLYPSLEKIYTPDVIDRIASRAAPVMQKYDFDLARLFGRWGDEIMLSAAVLPLVIPTVRAIKADHAAAKEQGAGAGAAAGNGTAGPAPVAPVPPGPAAAPARDFSHGFKQ